MGRAATTLLFHSSKMYMICLEAREVTSASRGQIPTEIMIFTFADILLGKAGTYQFSRRL